MGSVQTVIQALHHAQAGEWKDAHDLIDELEHPLAYWLHASLHREEGDQDNRLQENDLIARLGDVSAVRCGGTGGAGGQPGVGDRTYFQRQHLGLGMSRPRQKMQTATLSSLGRLPPHCV